MASGVQQKSTHSTGSSTLTGSDTSRGNFAGLTDRTFRIGGLTMRVYKDGLVKWNGSPLTVETINTSNQIPIEKSSLLLSKAIEKLDRKDRIEILQGGARFKKSPDENEYSLATSSIGGLIEQLEDLSPVLGETVNTSNQIEIE